jgi:hypothetical protein
MYSRELADGQVSQAQLQRRQWIATLAFMLAIRGWPKNRHFPVFQSQDQRGPAGLLSLGRSQKQKVRSSREILVTF